MDPKAEKVDAIVVAWNNCDLTIKCIEHLLGGSLVPNVLVVDNGSTDGTPGRVREQFPEVRLVELGENTGFGPAANVGFAHSDAELVAIVNNDAFVDTYCIERIVTAFDDPAVGFAAGLSVNPDSGMIDAAGGYIDRGANSLPCLAGADPAQITESDVEGATPCFDLTIFRRSAIDEVEGFDGRIFAYWEDVDITLRLTCAGWSNAIVPSAIVMHLGSATLGKRSLAQLRLWSWGRGYIAGRYRVGAGWLLLDFASSLADVVRVRSPLPLTRKVSGFRLGRSLPRREFPDDQRFVGWRESLAIRFGLSR